MPVLYTIDCSRIHEPDPPRREIESDSGHRGCREERALLDLQLLGQQQRARLMVQPDGVELHLKRHGRGKPCAAHDAHLAAHQRELGDVLSQPHKIINLRLSHVSPP